MARKTITIRGEKDVNLLSMQPEGWYAYQGGSYFEFRRHEGSYLWAMSESADERPYVQPHDRKNVVGIGETIQDAANNDWWRLKRIAEQGLIDLARSEELQIASAQLRIWIVSCRHCDTDRVRRFAVAASTMGAAFGLVMDAMPEADRGRSVHDTWRASPSPHGSVLEVGSGGDVGIGGLS